MLIDRRLIAEFDWGLLSITLAIPLVGLLVLYSAGYSQEGTTHAFLPIAVNSPAFSKQIVFLGAGLVAMVVGLSIPGSFFSRIAYLTWVVGVFLLLLVEVLGKVSHGAQRWFALGPIHVQPAEFMKIALVLTLARYLSRRVPGERGYGFLQLIVPAILVGLPMVLIARQPDLGTALVVGWLGFSMLLFMGVDWRPMAIAGVIFLASLYPVWRYGLHDYQKRRLISLVDPEADPLGSGYHITQSKIAVGSGAFFGKGFMQGTQTQLEFLPEHTTDFIFSCLAEEWGFVGSAFVVFLYFILISQLLRVAARARDLFETLLAFGISSLLFFHAAVNMGMVIGLLPVVGVPLPLFSYGGSSVLTTMFCIGLVLGAGMRRRVYV